MEIEKGTKFRSVKREIKFRAWDKIKKEMVELTLLGLHYGFHKELTVYGVENDKGNISTNAPVMQYTGLKDCNNKDIYEGDIIKNEHSWNKITQVIFGEFIADDTYYGCPCAFVTSDEDCNQLSSRIEIIGNIYENPELLEDKK